MDRVPEELFVTIAKGERRTIVAYVGRDGRARAQEFLDALDHVARSRYAVRFCQLCQDGTLRGQFLHPWDSKKSKKSKNAKDLQCFKDIGSKTRIPCFPSGDPGVLVLTHGFRKKEDKLDEAEIDRADTVRCEFQTRRAEMRAKGTPSVGKRISGGRGQ